MTRTLSHREARTFYDRFGARQDSQEFYEDAAIEDLIRHSDLSGAHSVVELGCGTGRLAARLLARELPRRARYLGLDVSDTMVALASSRLAPYRDRAEVRVSDGSIELPSADGSVDRVVSTYVADLLDDADTAALLAEARRVLKPQGLVCLAGLAPGTSLLGRLVSRAWSAVHDLRPSLVGGCRPVRLSPVLLAGGWSLTHAGTVQAWGITSEVLVARPG